ncbi:hypothetical protein EIP91_009003 [Steccherinum ochraceum]|uniref:Uncharacterized protein n=1 Tax=Steccherinum ochraceum TaxID=92696 RepID=A0A4R0RC31_9APHY|nr:hypothetical protein EIP91_009003 [Steccherinum ochraceum]
MAVFNFLVSLLCTLLNILSSCFVFLVVYAVVLYPATLTDIEAAVHQGNYPSPPIHHPLEDSFPQRLVYLWLLLFHRSVAYLSWVFLFSYILAAFEPEPQCILHVFPFPWSTWFPVFARWIPLCVRLGLSLYLNFLRISSAYAAVTLFILEFVGLSTFTKHKHRRLKRVKHQVKHHILGTDGEDSILGVDCSILVHSFRHPRRLTLVLEVLALDFQYMRPDARIIDTTQALSELLDGKLEIDGYHIDWKVSPCENDLSASIGLHLRRFRVVRWWRCLKGRLALPPRVERIYPPHRYLTGTAWGDTLAPTQTLDGVPPHLLPAVLQTLVASLQPGSSVTLDFSARGTAMSSIFRSSLFLATALALDSHGYVRHRLLDNSKNAGAGMYWHHPVSAYYDSTLPLFITAEAVVQLLRSVKVPMGISIAMKETSVEHIEVLEERLRVIKGALMEPSRIHDERPWYGGAGEESRVTFALQKWNIDSIQDRVLLSIPNFTRKLVVFLVLGFHTDCFYLRSGDEAVVVRRSTPMKEARSTRAGRKLLREVDRSGRLELTRVHWVWMEEPDDLTESSDRGGVAVSKNLLSNPVRTDVDAPIQVTGIYCAITCVSASSTIRRRLFAHRDRVVCLTGSTAVRLRLSELSSAIDEEKPLTPSTTDEV